MRIWNFCKRCISEIATALSYFIATIIKQFISNCLFNGTKVHYGGGYKFPNFKGKVAWESETFAKRCNSDIASALSSFIAPIIKQLFQTVRLMQLKRCRGGKVAWESKGKKVQCWNSICFVFFYCTDLKLLNSICLFNGTKWWGGGGGDIDSLALKGK